MNRQGMFDRPRRRIGLVTAAAAVSFAVIAAGCSSDSGSDATDGSTTSITAATSAPSTTYSGHSCNQGPTMESIEETPVDGVASDRTLTSFDGTKIRIHWFPAPSATPDKPAPTVLMGPGWSLGGDTSVDGAALFGALGIGAQNKEGYNVLTWDPRGFGESTGQANVDDPAHEGRDTQMLLDWVAARPEAQTDREGDPRVGMVGYSYGGGIQLVLASIDCRVDAIVPGIAWHSLVTSLGKADTLKEGWAGFLVGSVPPDHVDPHVTDAFESGKKTGTVGAESKAWFEARGPGDNVADIKIPTLLIQGTVDTLFTLDEAVTNYTMIAKSGVPVKMLWFCGGHGACLTETGDPERVADASFAWLDRYVKNKTDTDTGPGFDMIDQDGTRWTGDRYPPEPAAPLEADGSGNLKLVAEGGAGPLTTKPAEGDLLGGLVTGFTPAMATNAVNVEIPATKDTLVVGAPQLTLTYSGTSPDGEKPTRLFAQLVDDERGVVVGNQITPIEVTLDGQSHTVDVDLEMVAQHLKAGQSLTLQIVATTTAYSVPRLGGEVDLHKITISLPTTTALDKG